MPPNAPYILPTRRHPTWSPCRQPPWTWPASPASRSRRSGTLPRGRLWTSWRIATSLPYCAYARRKLEHTARYRRADGSHPVEPYTLRRDGVGLNLTHRLPGHHALDPAVQHRTAEPDGRCGQGQGRCRRARRGKRSDPRWPAALLARDRAVEDWAARRCGSRRRCAQVRPDPDGACGPGQGRAGGCAHVDLRQGGMSHAAVFAPAAGDRLEEPDRGSRPRRRRIQPRDTRPPSSGATSA
jgi:hypothetical protein